MLSRTLVLGFVVSFLGASLATAGDMGSVSYYRPVGTLFGGIANLSLSSSSHTFLGTDDDVFVYNGANNSKTTGLGGVFLGVESALTHTNFFLQAGLEYSYFGNAYSRGLNTVGIEPETSTAYQYQYTLQTQQLLAVAKLFTTTQLAKTKQILYPYVSLGLGAAFNRAKNYQAVTSETGSINLTPTFADQSHTAFSYSLGFGVDSPISQHTRIGIGYRFSDFQRANLGSGQVVFNQYAYPVSFSLHIPHTYANQVIAQISYVA